uniref:Uncharacterized protein n=1 Tax=Arundo donax TaxID=35708 RepID=A0A0A9HC35_ARUDO
MLMCKHFIGGAQYIASNIFFIFHPHWYK